MVKIISIGVKASTKNQIRFLLFTTLLKISSQCGKFCHDCRNNICYTCYKSKWDSVKKSCEPTSDLSNCLIWSRDNLCVQCMEGFITEYSLTKNNNFEIVCKTNTDPERNTKLHQYCALLREETKNGVKNIYCYICSESSKPDSKFEKCVKVEREMKGCSQFYFFNNFDECYRCAQNNVFLNGECIPTVSAESQVSSKMRRCSNAISQNFCEDCEYGFYLHSDGTCLSDNN